MLFLTCNNLVPIVNSLTEIDYKLKITLIKLTATLKYHDQNGIFVIFKLFEACTYNLTLLIYSFYVLFVNATNN